MLVIEAAGNHYTYVLLLGILLFMRVFLLTCLN